MSIKQWMNISTLQFEAAVRVRLNLETLTLIIMPQSVVFFGGLQLRIRVRVSSHTFRTLLMVRVWVWVISGYDVIMKMFTALRIKLPTVMWTFSSTL